jgi:hypothetical protein
VADPRVAAPPLIVRDRAQRMRVSATTPTQMNSPGELASALVRPRVELTGVAWVPLQELMFDEWCRHGARIGVAGRSSAWWIGDWVRYGAVQYGQKYAVAARVTGYDHQTLMNMVYVANRYAASRRREKLSWSHHAELAALSDAEQDAWLDRVTSRGLTVRALRRELATEGAVSNRSFPSSTTKRATIPLVSCPQCGHEFLWTMKAKSNAARLVS